MFAYCGNDPAIFSDATGTRRTKDPVAAIDIGDSGLEGDGTALAFSGTTFSSAEPSLYSTSLPSADSSSTTSGSSSTSYTWTNNTLTITVPNYSPEYAATVGTPYEIGLAGENLAGIDQSAKITIDINGHKRIPDELTPAKLKEVKNVKYISNTSQLRDFADYASTKQLIKELWVRPTTKIAKTIIKAGWKIIYLDLR